MKGRKGLGLGDLFFLTTRDGNFGRYGGGGGIGQVERDGMEWIREWFWGNKLLPMLCENTNRRLMIYRIRDDQRNLLIGCFPNTPVLT